MTNREVLMAAAYRLRGWGWPDLAHLLELEETYLVGNPGNESLAHVSAAIKAAKEVMAK